MKKILAFFAIIMLFAATTVCAEETVVIPSFNVSFNDKTVENDYRQFPLIVYKDITYVPMTYYDCRYLGLTAKWDNDTRTLSIKKGDISCAYRDYKWQWKNSISNSAEICNFNIVINGKPIDNTKEDYPLLTFRDVTYFPLTWRFAAEEFGWDYNFDLKSGLRISSDNYHVKNVHLPNITGAVATDGKYYYYSGNKDGKNVVFRALVSDTENSEVIHEIPDTPLSTNGASFKESCGDIYITYFAGSSPITGTLQSYKIEADGSVTKGLPTNNYSGGNHGYSEFHVENDGIKVKGVNQYFDSATEFSYEINGETHIAEKLPSRVRVGRKRNGNAIATAEMHDCVQIFENKIYYTAIDLDANADSSLYCIDTLTGKNEKLIDGVCGFYVYKGWESEKAEDSTMIIYDNNGRLMRYSELNGDIREIENGPNDNGLILETAVGGYDIYTVQKTIGGDRTVVKVFACYAQGNASLNGAVLLDTKTGTFVSKNDDKLYVAISGESPLDEKRLLLAGSDFKTFTTADATNGVFIYNDILLYKIGNDTVVRVDLKQ